MMKVLHFIMGRASQNTANGVNKVIHGHAKYGNRLGHEVKVVGLSSSQKSTYELVQRDGFEVHSFNKFFGGVYDMIKRVSDEVDIVHLHSVWNHYNLIIARFLRENDIPYVITSHSGLREDRLKQSNYFFKLCYHKIFQKKLFDKAAGVHALTNEESTSLRKYTSNPSIFVVENGVDHENQYYPREKKSNESILKLGFLGRLSIEKNIINLIEAFSLIPIELRDKCELKLIGPCNKAEKKEITKLIEKLELSKTIELTGSKYGNDKIDVLSTLDCYIHPAFSDVVSIAVMEAFSYSIPSIITRTSDMAYYYDSGAFIMIEPDAKSIAAGIVKFLNSRDRHAHMAVAAKQLSIQKFNWTINVARIFEEYKGIK